MLGFRAVNVLATVKEAMKEIMANIDRLGFSFIFSLVVILWRTRIILAVDVIFLNKISRGDFA